MFSTFKNIDRAFQHIRTFSVVFLLVCLALSAYALYMSFRLVGMAQNRVMVLYNGKVLQAFGTSRKENLAVELRDHIRTFHEDFFTLDPDEKSIAAGITKAFYLADNSARRAYENLKESGFYNNLIAANISASIAVDSIELGTEPPYAFRCFATQKLVRSSSTVYRRLVTRGKVRVQATQSDNNPHGFLIEDWETLENADLSPEGLRH